MICGDVFIITDGVFTTLADVLLHTAPTRLCIKILIVRILVVASLKQTVYTKQKHL